MKIKSTICIAFMGVMLHGAAVSQNLLPPDVKFSENESFSGGGLAGEKNGWKYRYYLSDGSGTIAGTKANDLDYRSSDFDKNWSVGCKKDAMSDHVFCTAYKGDFFIYYPKNGRITLSVMGDKYPRSQMSIRVDGGKVYSANESASFNETQSKAILNSIKDGSKVATRYVNWPYKTYVDKQEEFFGLGTVLEYLKWATKNIK